MLIDPFFNISRLQASTDLREALVEKLKVAAESTLSAEERSLRMEEILEAEERRQKEMRVQIKVLGDTIYRKNRELQEARAMEKMKESQIEVNLQFCWKFVIFAWKHPPQLKKKRWKLSASIYLVLC